MKKKAKAAKTQDEEQDNSEEEVAASASKEREPTKSSKKRAKQAHKDAKHADEADEAPAAPAKGAGKGSHAKIQLRNAADDPLVKEVVALILEGISKPEAQKDGKAFVPTDWALKYKPKLGPYKKFLQAHPDNFALVEDGTGLFVIKSPADVDASAVSSTKAPLVKGSTWQKKLIDAWMAYCLLVPREKRDFELFLGPLPRSARLAKPGTDPSAPAPAAAPAASGEKKRKSAAISEEPAAEESQKKKKKKKKIDIAV